MNLSSTQIKDTYGNLVTIGSVAGTPTTGTLQNGAGSDLTSITLNGGAVFNEGGGDFDFRVEGVGQPNLLFVDASTARVGIGTSTPAVKLDVSGQVYISGTNSGSTSDDPVATIRLEDTDTSVALNQPIGKIEFYGNDGTTPTVGVQSYILAKHAATNGGANLMFATASAGSASATERMRITSTGNVGIGTNDPQSILTDFSSQSRGLAISNAYPFVGFNDTDGGKFFVGTQANIAYLWNNGTSDMIFATNTAERLRIDSSGGLIGKAAAGGHTIFNEDGIDADFRVESDNDTHCLFVDGGNDRVGIGTSAPLALLSVNGEIVHQDGTFSAKRSYADVVASLTASTGTVTITFDVATGQGGFVNLTIYAGSASSNVSSNKAAAQYQFVLHCNTSDDVSLVSPITQYEKEFVYATHVAFANLGTGQCTLTITNPLAVTARTAMVVETFSTGMTVVSIS